MRARLEDAAEAPKDSGSKLKDRISIAALQGDEVDYADVEIDEDLQSSLAKARRLKLRREVEEERIARLAQEVAVKVRRVIGGRCELHHYPAAAFQGQGR